jgi:hypothetical protein
MSTLTLSAINAFLLRHRLLLADNPCISPDFCLDWPVLAAAAQAGRVRTYARSRFATAAGSWVLFEAEASGDCGWRLTAAGGPADRDVLEGGMAAEKGAVLFPASFTNLLRLKNLVQELDPATTIFPTAAEALGRSTLGIGARFTTLHWPAVEWAMAQLGLGLTANQNSIPRELVYDVDAMLAGALDTVPFPFIGAAVPEGHQGQSVEGMSHGCILSKLKTGFHLRRIPWAFNADHQPIGGKFDRREDRLVAGCLLASYITFDLSPELAQTAVPENPAAWVRQHVPPAILAQASARMTAAGVSLPEPEFERLIAYVWPALQKMQRRDAQYRAARAAAFTTEVGRAYLRELSIDELPGLTSPETTAAMLALCEALGMKIHFVAPAFGFQKNLPFADNSALRALVARQWAVCARFDTGIGFHSGSGKSAENYRVMGEMTGRRLEIKTSGRYTYEMGRALAESSDPGDQKLWRDWHHFTLELALLGAFAADPTERKMARVFISDALGAAGRPLEPYESPAACRLALEALSASPENMFWFEYNFLFVLAAGGRPEKSALGDHTPAGYAQRSRFYTISPEARLRYARHVADYILFLAETTGLAEAAACAAARAKLASYATLDQLVDDITGHLEAH